jgi:hypothetical protein
LRRHEIPNLNELYIGADFDDLAGNLVPKNESRGSGGAASDHMLVAAADVRHDDLQNHAVLGFFATRIHQFGIVDIANLDLAGLDVNNTTIAWHDCLLRSVRFN